MGVPPSSSSRPAGPRPTPRRTGSGPITGSVPATPSPAAPSVRPSRRAASPDIALEVVPALSTFELGSARVTPVPAAHTTLDLSSRGYPCYGYVLEWNGVTLYHAGDTLIYGDTTELPGGLLGVLSRWSIDVALLPANGGDYFRSHRLQNPVDPNLNFREAVDLASALGVRLLVPTHTDLFGFNTENLAYLVDYARRSAPRSPNAARSRRPTTARSRTCAGGSRVTRAPSPPSPTAPP